MDRRGRQYPVGYWSTIGSLAGDGTVFVGGNNTLTVGGDNTSTTFSGVYREAAGSTALVKTGNGTLTLSGSNTYSIRDYGVGRQTFRQTNCGNPADLDGNCLVDIRDYGIWRPNFGHTAGAASAGGALPVWSGVRAAAHAEPHPAGEPPVGRGFHHC